jgi:hypothetical protein
MDETSVLLGALRAKARLGAPRLMPAEAEALAAAAGIEASALPSLVARLAEAGQVKLAWGGVVEVLPEPPAQPGGVVIDARGAQFGQGATLGGHGTTGATVTTNTGIAAGELAAVLHELRALQAELTGEAAACARAAEKTLRERPAPDAPEEVKHGWAERMKAALDGLLDRAPKAKVLVELAEKALTLSQSA